MIWMYLENILGARSQSQMPTYCIIPLTLNGQTRQTHREKSYWLLGTKRVGGKWVWLLTGMDTYGMGLLKCSKIDCDGSTTLNIVKTIDLSTLSGLVILCKSYISILKVNKWKKRFERNWD